MTNATRTAVFCRSDSACFEVEDKRRKQATAKAARSSVATVESSIERARFSRSRC